MKSNDLEYIFAYSLIVASYAALVYSKMLRDQMVGFTYFGTLTGSSFTANNSSGDKSSAWWSKVSKSLLATKKQAYGK